MSLMFMMITRGVHDEARGDRALAGHVDVDRGRDTVGVPDSVIDTY
jgi:hypothetical protein